MRILFFGDSITQGFWDIEGGWVERVRKHYTQITLQDLAHNPEVDIFNLGILGDTTHSLLSRVESETKVRSWPGEPLVVVIAIGTNDDLFEHNVQWTSPDDFKANLEKMIALLTPLARAIVLVGNPACDETRTTPVFWGDYHYTNAELVRSERAIQEVASQHRLPFVPLFDLFKRQLDAGEQLLGDGLHPNDAGHKLIAAQVLPVIDRLVQQHAN